MVRLFDLVGTNITVISVNLKTNHSVTGQGCQGLLEWPFLLFFVLLSFIYLFFNYHFFFFFCIFV